jgi:phospholipase/carboxylesterase
VLLHGRGGDEDAMWIFARALPAGTLVLAPRAPHATVDLGGFAWVPRQDDEWPALAEFAPAAAIVQTFLAALPEHYGADPARLGVLGFSQGAATALAMALLGPARAAPIASLVGFAPEGLDAARPGGSADLGGLPVLMLAGTQDHLVPVERARASAAALRAAGARVSYHEHPVGHKISPAGMRELAAWWSGWQAEVTERGGSGGAGGA